MGSVTITKIDETNRIIEFLVTPEKEDQVINNISFLGSYFKPYQDSEHWRFKLDQAFEFNLALEFIKGQA